MMTNYQMAEASIAEVDKQRALGMPDTEGVAMGLLVARASLAAADSSREVLKALETSNLIAYAQLCHSRRDGGKAAKASRAADRAMASVLGLQDDDEDSL